MTDPPPHNPLLLREWYIANGYTYPYLLSLPAQRDLASTIQRRIEHDERQRIKKPARTGRAMFAGILG